MAKPNNNRWSNVEMKSAHITQLMRKINELENALGSPGDSSGMTWLSTFGSAGSGNGEFSDAYAGVAVGSRLFILDISGASSRVQEFTMAGVYVAQFALSNFNPRSITTDGELLFIAFDTATGDVICAYNLSGVLQYSWGGHGFDDGEFSTTRGAQGMCFLDSEIYVCDYHNYRVQVFDTSGNFLRKFSHGTWPYGIVGFNSTLYVNAANNITSMYSPTGSLLGFISLTGYHYRHAEALGLFSASITKMYRKSLLGVAIEDITLPAPYTSACAIVKGLQHLYVCRGTVVDIVQLPIEGAGTMTSWFYKTKAVTDISMGTPDAGINVPALDALRMKVPMSELTDTTVIELADTYLLQIRAALKTLVDAAAILNPKTGTAYNFNAGDTTNNVYYVAMNPHMADYGLTGETLYSWARPLDENETDYYDVDIGEVWRVTEVLYDAARIQGLL